MSSLVQFEYLYHTDEAEWDRLLVQRLVYINQINDESSNMQHKMIVMAIGGMLPCSEELVEAILAPDGEEPKRVLDAGTSQFIFF